MIHTPLAILSKGAAAAVLLGGAAAAGLSPGRAGAADPEPFPVPAIPWSPRHYVCCRAAAPPAIDGRIEEAVWTAAPWTEPFTDIQGPLAPEPRHLTRAKMLWDEHYLYIAAELEEPHVWGTLTERDAVIYHDNDFEVFIDPDGDTHEYYELEVNALGTVWDLLLIKPYRDGGPAVNAWDIAGLKSAVYIEGTLNDPADTDTGWSVEIALPWKVLAECAHRPAPPAPGDQWRINFSRVEWQTRIEDGRYVKVADPQTGRALPEDNWVWSPQGLIAMHYPEMWGFVQFSNQPAGEEEFRPDPCGPARWALQRIYYAQREHYLRHGTFAAGLEALGLSGANPAGGAPAGQVAAETDAAAAIWATLAMESTSELFEARLRCPDGAYLRIRQDGRIW